MRKFITVLVILMALLLTTCAFAEGMGVQVIGGPDTETEPVTLDDFKLKVDAEIDGYAILTGTSFETVDKMSYYNGSYSGRTNSSGEDADYAVLNIDITNTLLKDRNFLDSCTVKAIYDDTYEYGGWCYQYNYDKSNDYVLGEKELEFAIQPMYAGHYAFGATLPNAVINGKQSLRLEINLDGNEITYYIRK